LDEQYAPIPSLLALAAVHNLLVREETRTQVALIIESGEPREVMHFALLIGYGASAINPYLAIETMEDLAERGYLPDGISGTAAVRNFTKAIDKGLLKTFSKMGISTLQSYRGAQVFEAIGVKQVAGGRIFRRNYFENRRSRVGCDRAGSTDASRIRAQAGNEFGDGTRVRRRLSLPRRW
jgi:glutamate synthase domain-containing protein 2